MSDEEPAETEERDAPPAAAQVIGSVLKVAIFCALIAFAMYVANGGL